MIGIVLGTHYWPFFPPLRSTPSMAETPHTPQQTSSSLTSMQKKSVGIVFGTHKWLILEFLPSTAFHPISGRNPTHAPTAKENGLYSPQNTLVTLISSTAFHAINARNPTHAPANQLIIIISAKENGCYSPRNTLLAHFGISFLHCVPPHQWQKPHTRPSKPAHHNHLCKRKWWV